MKTYPLKNNYGETFKCGAPVVVVENDGKETLFSYWTEIMSRNPDGTMTRAWDDWTQTTGKHIKAFCGLNKAGFCALPMEKKGG